MNIHQHILQAREQIGLSPSESKILDIIQMLADLNFLKEPKAEPLQLVPGARTAAEWIDEVKSICDIDDPSIYAILRNLVAAVQKDAALFALKKARFIACENIGQATGAANIAERLYDECSKY